MEDYYKILGVDRNASKDKIKKEYRKLAHKHHPDKGGDEKTFKKISEAYHVLSNDKKREQYDRFGKSGPGAGGAGFGGSGEGFGGFEGFSQEGFDFGDIFEDFFGFGRGPKRRRQKGEDLKVRIITSLEKVIKDEKRDVTIEKLVLCNSCGGSGDEKGAKKKNCDSCKGEGRVKKETGTFFGAFSQIVTCPDCDGEGSVSDKKCGSCHREGRVSKKEKIDFVIPAGIDNGQTLKVDGKGNAGRRGNPSGDLYIEIVVENKTKFERKGADLYYKAKIKFSQAVLGDTVELKLISGKIITLKIPEKSFSGKIIRISGKGLPKLSGYGYGNLYVVLEIDIPQKITKKQKDILRELGKEGL